jgi:hypothetical protein
VADFVPPVGRAILSTDLTLAALMLVAHDSSISRLLNLELLLTNAIQ